jgi:hypothetical protein
MYYTLYGVDDFGSRDFVKSSSDLADLIAIRDERNAKLDSHGLEEYYRYFVSYKDSMGEEQLAK